MAEKLGILIILGSVLLVAGEDVLIEKCGQNAWCEDCITARKECAWCKDEDFSYSRCSTLSDLQDKTCTDIFHPDNVRTFRTNKPLQDGSESTYPVQLQPQHMRVNVRPGKRLELDMTYKIATNLPLDLYFVLDFSTTMEPRLASLAGLTQNLINGLKEKFTTNIHIGFGSFLDKRAQPFHITTEKYMNNPCILEESCKPGIYPCERVSKVCAPSYGYIHRRRLNSNVQEFIDTMKRNETSGNFDPMEGGLDAIMQAAVCPDIIGWRSQSRRVLIYISESGFHFAGDGKLAGIDKPNDGECHMVPHEKAGEYIYSEELTQDYPSLGQIAEVLEKNKINTFFVVDDSSHRKTSNFYDGSDFSMYKDFKKMIKQAEVATMSQTGAEGIIESISDFYTKLSETVKISADGIPDNIELLLESNCGGNLNTKHTMDLKIDDFTCSDLRIGQSVHFSIYLQATECPANRSTMNTINIHPAGLQESLTIDVSYICDCECLQDDDLDMQKCTQANGTYECGVCRCKEGRSGEFCQCSGDDSSSSSGGKVSEENCKSNNNSDVLCENKGLCKCGQCSCFKFHTGKHCQCDSSKCIPLDAGESQEKCGGKDRGVCDCDRCVCKEQYAGDYCQCLSDSHCIGSNGRVCSGNGICNCGECQCKVDYSGDTCEICPRCDRCDPCGYKDCVKCLDIYKTIDNTSNTECQSSCQGINVTYVKRFENPNPCGAFDKDGCQITYIVECDTITEYLLIADKKRCTKPPNALLIAMPILAGIIGVGLILLIIWRILTSFYDKIEYARFEHETKHPKWNRESNPIYDPPVTTNMNPTYKGTID